MKRQNSFWKYLILLFFGCLTLNYVFSQQIGIQPTLIKPSGYMGYVMKPHLGSELFIRYGEDRFWFGLSVGYYKLNAKKDTFPDYIIQYGGGNYMYPGYFIWKSYSAGTVGFTFDFKCLNKKISPLVGTDLCVYAVNTEYLKSNTIVGMDYTGGNFAMAFVPKIGVIYDIKKRYFFIAGLAKSYAYNTDYVSYSYWKPYFSISYSFE